jgi:pimeloyl-ACP methyl ester carboxylesterase
MDRLFADPPSRAGRRAGMATPVFDSDGARLPGLLLTPAGDGPHPLVVILNGFPGNERNGDVAQALRRLGFEVLSFQYRGSWGTDGTWSWGNVLGDVANVLAAVAAEDIALVGHSLGGFAALMTAAADPRIRAVAAIAPFDLGRAGALAKADPARRAAYEAAFDGELLALRGTSGAALVDEMQRHAAQWSLAGLRHRRPVLLVGAGRDTVAEPADHFEPLVEAYRDGPGFRHLVLDTDHALSDRRVALITAVASFLT